MINNYLDWAKRERKWYVKSYVAHGRKFREVKDDWCKGFHKGLTLGYMDAAYNFKRLQKDIEATLKVVADNWPRESTDPLVAKFDI